jgi:hypothetical protein
LLVVLPFACTNFRFAFIRPTASVFFVILTGVRAQKRGARPKRNTLAVTLVINLCWALISVGVAFAGDSTIVQSCPSIKQVDEKIISCGNNAYAAAAADKCAKAVMQDWNRAAGPLKTLLPVLRSKEEPASPKERSADNTLADYRRAIAILDRQIRFLRKYAALLAKYTEIMIDLPSSRTAASSLECFNTAFDQVQRVVTQLDDEIIRAKAARAQATFLARGRRSGADVELGSRPARFLAPSKP